MQASRAPRISEAKWNTRRQKLESLYLDDNLSRQEIIETMAREDNFLATDKQLKYQFNKWGLKKYISDQDLTTMLSFKRKRQELGKNTGFVYRGHLFEQERLERASKRRKGPLISSPVLPPYIKALISPRQSPQMASFLPALGQISAVPNGAEEAIHDIERPIGLDIPITNSSYQFGDFGLSDAWNSVDAFSDPARFRDGGQNQADSGLWETLLDNDNVLFSPRHESLMPTPSRRDTEATGTENPSQLIRQIPRTTPDFPAVQSANDNDSPFSGINMDFDFSDFLNSPRGPSIARSSSSHAKPPPRMSDERISTSPLQLTEHNNTHSEERELNLVSRTTSGASQALGPVTGEDVRAESIASLLILLKSLVFPRFETASQKYEHDASVLSDLFCPDCCHWLCFGVEELLDSYLEGSLRSIRKRRIGRIQGSLSYGSDLYFNEPRQSFVSSDGTQQPSKPTEGTIATKLRSTFSRRYFAPMGVVVLQVREGPRSSMEEEEIGSNSLVIISIMPRAMKRTLGLCARFSRLMSGPAVSPQIDTFNVIPDDSAIIQCIYKNDLRGMQTLFDLGAASARDVDSRGISLLQYAIHTGCSEIFRLLLQGGASIYQCDDCARTTDVITVIWSRFARAHYSGGSWRGISTEEIKKFEQCVAMTQLALDNDCTIDNADDRRIAAGPLFSIVGFSVADANASASVDAINYLFSIGWDLEEKNSRGETPLLHAATECFPQIARCLRTLIERGARLDARDSDGRRPLHSALSPPMGLSDWVDLICTWSSEGDFDNNSSLAGLWNTEDHKHVYTLDPLTASTSPDTSRSTPSLDGVETSQPVFDDLSNIPTEQSIPIDSPSSDLDSDASSCAEDSILDSDDNDYVYCADDWGVYKWIRNPAHVLKDRVRTKLVILLEAGCDPNDLDDNGESPSDYARRGLWSQWLWALGMTGYVFDTERDRWIKQVTPA